jgi:hypothetical protein
MKEDTPAPDVIPTKRRPLEAAPDLWLRQWLNKEDITFREKKRIDKEIQRRKDEKPRVSLGVLVPQEGVTPKQLRALDDYIKVLQPTEVHHDGVPSKVHQVVKRYGVDPVVHRDIRLSDNFPEVVKNSTVVVALPKEPYFSVDNKPKTGVWEAVNYAKLRSIPVKVFDLDGKEVK